MKSLVISDIHDNIKNLETALQLATTASCDSIICCGDLCSSFILNLIHEKYKLPVHIVFGNNDGDKFHLIQKAVFLNTDRNQGCKITLHGEFLIAEKGHKLEGINSSVAIAVYHYPEMAEIIARSGIFDYVFYGHTHKSSIETKDICLLANPGSILGYIPSTKEIVAASCLIVNFESKELELIEL